MRELTMLVGISGSGKSYYIKQHYNKKYVVNVDDIRKELTGDINNQIVNTEAWKVAVDRTKSNLDKFKVSVLDATNTNDTYRKLFLDNFQDADIKKIAVIFETDPELAKSRVNQDIANKKDRAAVPDEIIDRQYQDFVSGRDNIRKQFDVTINANRNMEMLRNHIRNEIKAILNKNKLT